MRQEGINFDMLCKFRPPLIRIRALIFQLQLAGDFSIFSFADTHNVSEGFSLHHGFLSEEVRESRISVAIYVLRHR